MFSSDCLIRAARICQCAEFRVVLLLQVKNSSRLVFLVKVCPNSFNVYYFSLPLLPSPSFGTFLKILFPFPSFYELVAFTLPFPLDNTCRNGLLYIRVRRSLSSTCLRFLFRWLMNAWSGFNWVRNQIRKKCRWVAKDCEKRTLVSCYRHPLMVMQTLQLPILSYRPSLIITH
jgi:hypothetical protein